MADNFPANFPTTLDSYTTLVDNTDNITANHPNARGSAIAAIEAKVGVNSSAVNTSHDYLLSHLPGQATDFDAGTVEIRALTFESDQATGTAPMVVASTTVVTNFNADTVDGKHVAGTNGAGEITTNDGTQTLTNKTLTSPVITGGLGTAQGGTGATAAANAASGVVVLDGSSKLPAVDGSQLTGLSAGGYTGMQVFTSSGTWTKPAGVTKAYVKVLGGGGEGAGSVAKGGGGGGYAEGVVTVTGDVTVTVGAGGTGGSTNGNPGGTSSFVGSTTISATGGGGGAFGGAGGPGGTGTGTLTFTGGAGGSSSIGGSGTGFSGAGGSGGFPNYSAGRSFWNFGAVSNTGYGTGGNGNTTSGDDGTAGIVIVYW